MKTDLLKMNVLCVLFVLCISAITVQGRSKTPLMDEGGPRIINKAAECLFGSQVMELGSSWVPDLGVPIGVLYCMKCECVPVQRKKRVIARVQCRSIKNDCPEPTCEEPELLPGNCCKSCPGDNYTEGSHEIIPQHAADPDDEKSTKHYAALLTGRSSIIMRDDDLRPIANENKNNVIATGRFSFIKKNLYFSFYISDKAARPRSLQFVKQDGSILEEIILSGTGGTVDSVYQNATRKVCGVWKRLPRDYRRLLKEEKLYVVLVWGVKDQAEFMLSGQITKYDALGTELFSSLLEPAPGTDSSMMIGAGGTAIVSTSASISSIHIAVVFNGIFTSEETNDVSIEIILSADERKIILKEIVKVEKPAHELNFIEISSPVSNNDLRQLARGKLVLTVASVSNPQYLRLSGNVMTKATCELFQTTLAPAPGVTTSHGTSGLAWLFLNNEGSLVYNVQVDGLQQETIALTLYDLKKKIELEELTPYYKNGWANGTVDKIGPKVLELLYSGNMVVNVATKAETSFIRGKLIARLVAEARDAPAPVLLKHENHLSSYTPVGMAWVNVDNECNIHYDVSLTAPNNQERLELYLEFLPLIAPGAPNITRLLGDIQGNQAEGCSIDPLTREELKMLDSGVCFIKVREKSGKILLVATLKQVKVPATCIPHSPDNEIPLYEPQQPSPIFSNCFYEERFYENEKQWTSTQDPCTMCFCHNGKAKCDTTICPELNCPDSQTVKYPEECCAICVNTSNPDLPSTNCIFGGKYYSSGSKFHPFLIPNGFDSCTECVCNNSEVKCARLSNNKQCCKNCDDSYRAMSENNTLISDGVDHLPQLLNQINNTKNVENILEQGGCVNPGDPKRPYENGKKFHPFIASLGEYKCVTCKCKDRNVTCERPKCNRNQCHKMFKAHKNNTLSKDSPESCCSIQQCKRYRRHHRNHNKF